MKAQVKKFGQFINEGWFSRESEERSEAEPKTSGEEISDITDFGVYKTDGDLRAGTITRISTGEEIYVQEPEEDSTDWSLSRWNEYVCRLAEMNGVNCVYFPEQKLAVKC
jgi:hypothetical protein